MSSSSSTHVNHLPVSISSVNATVKTQNRILWNMRMGYPSNKVLHHVNPTVCNKIDNKSFHLCHVYPIFKQCNLFFPSASLSHVAQPFELIHIDIWGPYFTPTHKGCRYFLTIVDDCSRATWTYLMSTKQRYFQILNDYFP